MKKRRSLLATIVQVVASVGGIIGFVYLVALYIPASKVFFTDDANIGDVIATVLAFIPLSLLIGPVCIIFGIINLIISIQQRKNEETKDVFSLIFLIIGIILIVIPAGMIASMFIASAAKSGIAESAIRFIML